MIKTFKNKLATGEQDTIRLSTNQGKIGYKIIKFELISPSPGTNTCELIGKVFTREQLTIDGGIDFANSELLACAYFAIASSTFNSTDYLIFDNVKVNQDIFVTAFDASGNGIDTNYYLELEQFNLSENEATVATLKDMRGSN